MKASDLLVRCLEAEGVQYVFGVPGEENADFMMSLEDSDIDFVLTRHEQGAAFMADVYGRLTGEPAVGLGTLGPGATNLVTGVADANMDRSPMLVLTGQGATTRLHKETHQIMDVVAMYEPITKWAQSVHHARQHPRGRAQGRPHRHDREARAPATSSCPRTSPTTRRRPSRSRRSASAARCPTTRSSTRPGRHPGRRSGRSSSPATAPSAAARASSCACSSSRPASASSARSWPRAASTWTPSTACSPSACRRGTTPCGPSSTPTS